MKTDKFYTHPRLLAKPEIFMVDMIAGIYISTMPFFVHESGQWISVKDMYSPDYKPCLAVESNVGECYYIYNYTDDTLKRLKLSNDNQLVCSMMDVNKYYKLINWIVKNLPWRNRHR